MRSFSELIQVPALTELCQVETVLGNQLIRAEVLRIEIEGLRQIADRDRWQQTVCMLAVGLLVGAVVGCLMITRIAGR